MYMEWLGKGHMTCQLDQAVDPIDQYGEMAFTLIWSSSLLFLRLT